MTGMSTAALLATLAATAATSACSSAGSNKESVPPPSATSSVPTVPATASTASPTSGQAPTTSATPSSPAAPASFTADSTKYVAAAWLTTAQLPFESTFSWKNNGVPTGGGQKNVIQQDWYSCDTPAWSTAYSAGTDAVQQIGYTTAAGPQAELTEQQIFFPDTVSAQKALGQIAHDFTVCAAQTTGESDHGTKQVIVLKKSASTGSGFAYVHTARNQDGTEAGAGVLHWGTDAHEYFVQQGNVVVLVTLYGTNPAGGQAIDNASSDSTILQNITNGLTTAYAGS